MRYFTTVFLFLFFTLAVYGQKYSNEFLSIGVDARGQAMGSALAASTQNAMASYWNPAGLMGIEEELSIGLMHSEWYAGVGNFDFIGIAKPITKSKRVKRVLGLSFIRFGIDNIPNTLSLYDDDGTINYQNIVPFSATDYAVLLSYAQGIYTYEVGKLTIGGNAKVIHRKIGPFATAWGFGIDVGLQFEIGDLKLGFLGKDISNTFNAWKIEFSEKEKEVLELTDNKIPIGSLEVTRPQFIFGGAYGKEFGKVGFLFETDLTVTTDGRRNTLIQGDQVSIDPTAGIELSYNKAIFLRAGINNIQQELDLNYDESWVFQPSMGVGIKFYKLYIDYALTNVGSTAQKSYSHIISLSIDFDFDYFKKVLNNQ